MHYEQPYLDLMRRVWTTGDRRMDRTGVGTRALFGETLRFDLSGDAIPLLTTKRVFWKTALRELLWFISGDTNIRSLVAQGVGIWTDWPHARHSAAMAAAGRPPMDRRDFEASIVADEAFAAKWGDLGPVYGHQWVRWPDHRRAEDGRYDRVPGGIDQLSALVAMLRDTPGSRRLILAGWNVADLPAMALPPCHMTYQFFVGDGGRLSCLLHQRSCDLGLGFAFNVFEAAVLTRMLAQQAGLGVAELVWVGGDVHLYENHRELVETQLSRVPSGQPTLTIGRRPADIHGYRFDDFAVAGYDPQPAIPAPVAV